jgi:hypothetical protein
VLDPDQLAAIDDDVAALLTELDTTVTTFDARLDDLEDRVLELETGSGPPPPVVVVPEAPDPEDVRVVVNGRDVRVTVTAPGATMAQFDVDPGATIEESGLSHTRVLEPGTYAVQVAVGNTAGWSTQSPGVPFTIVDDTPVPPDPPPTTTDRVTPLVSAGPVSHVRFHDLAPNTIALQMTGSGWDAGHLVFERVAQAVVWATSGHLHDVDIWNFGRGGAGTSGQAHGVYGREGLVERVRVHSIDPSAPNGSSAFHAHKESGPVTGLTYRDCENHSGADSIIAGYRAGLANNTVDGFVQTAGKFRIGVANQANGGNNVCTDLDLALLQIDGASWGDGCRFAGRTRRIAHAGAERTKAWMESRYPNVDFDGLTVG